MPTVPETVTAPRGYRANAVVAGLKASGRPDLALLVSDRPATAAGVFTTNRVHAYNVERNRRLLAAGRPLRAVLVNAGNANVATGEQGRRDTETMAALAAAQLDCSADEVAVAQTGVIGVPLRMEGIREMMPALAGGLDIAGGERAAQAIMTTDTRLKQAARTLRIGRREVRVGVMAKGAGMIHPNMATLLCFVTTDAALSTGAAQELLAAAVDETLNLVTIDGDQSTSDTCLLLANGASDTPPIESSADPGYAPLLAAVQEVLEAMARAVAADGEGATRLVTVEVTGAHNVADARLAARAVAGSNLVKCAVHGRDPNWGRIAAAVGYSGAEFDPAALCVTLQDTLLLVRGEPQRFDPTAVSAALGADEVRVRVELGAGEARARAYGCDLSAEYVSINSDYTT
ncbi:MAG TPA: hypothetical protein DCZ72_07285 [Armatimonadetes bacterium]|nr:hypothetical protein [Armatimonadota bacterium]